MLSEPVFLGTKQISKQPRTCYSFPDSGPSAVRWCFGDRSLSLLKMVVMDSERLLYKRYLFVKWPTWSKKASVNPLGFSAEVNETRKSMHTNSIDCPRIWIFVWLSQASNLDLFLATQTNEFAETLSFLLEFSRFCLGFEVFDKFLSFYLSFK